jgi:hypothetical protein
MVGGHFFDINLTGKGSHGARGDNRWERGREMGSRRVQILASLQTLARQPKSDNGYRVRFERTTTWLRSPGMVGS